MEHALGTVARPLRVAIIGAGPAGFYAAEALLKQPSLTVSIDIFNHFPYPYGLVRDGVAPDHQSIKAVTRVYDKILQDPRVRYFGNVTFGSDITRDEILRLYDQVVYAVGAQSDRHMDIPGEDLDGSFPATIFVGWYNGHPDYADLDFDLSGERAVVIGVGNVAVDVARILVRDPDELAATDISDVALERLRHSKIREVVILGRRGPAQAAFTSQELKEFGELKGVNVIVDPADLQLDPDSQEMLANDRVAARNVDLLRGYATHISHDRPRTLRIRFLVSPVELISDQLGSVKAVRIERNRLEKNRQGKLLSRGIGEYEVLPATLVLRSVGYRSVPLRGVPFDDTTYTIMNIGGRVVDPHDTEPLPGEYVVGWAKRGPNGIIGTNKPDAVATVQAMLADAPTLLGVSDDNRDPARVDALLQAKGIDYVSFEDWQVLDRHETERGLKTGRPRVKVTSVPEMLAVIRGQATT